MHPYRTHTCGQLRAANAGTEARLSGWVFRKRDHGSLLFIDLRDREGRIHIIPYHAMVRLTVMENVDQVGDAPEL